MNAPRLCPVLRDLRLPLLIVLAVALAVLAGCTTTPRMVEVRVPVPVECRVAKPQRPAMPTESLTLSDSIERKVRALLAELELREGYEIQLAAALDACTTPQAASP